MKLKISIGAVDFFNLHARHSSPSTPLQVFLVHMHTVWFLWNQTTKSNCETEPPSRIAKPHHQAEPRNRVEPSRIIVVWLSSVWDFERLGSVWYFTNRWPTIQLVFCPKTNRTIYTGTLCVEALHKSRVCLQLIWIGEATLGLSPSVCVCVLVYFSLCFVLVCICGFLNHFFMCYSLRS